MVNLYEYHVGDRVRVLSYDELVENYPLDGNLQDRFNCEGLCFTPDMKQFCGEVFEIEMIYRNGYGLVDYDDNNIVEMHFPRISRCFNSLMVQPVGNNRLLKSWEEEFNSLLCDLGF